MTRTYSQTEVVALVDDLTEQQLLRYVGARIVRPAQAAAGAVYGETDVARLRLACDLQDNYALPDDALEMVLGLLDQLNTMRGDMRALMQAVAAEPGEVRTRIRAVVCRAR